MLQLDSKTTSEFEQLWVKKLKVFLYDAGCSGSKIDILCDDFEVNTSLEKMESETLFSIYVEKEDKEKLSNCRITRTVKADHTGQEKTRYIFTSEAVEDRCGCGTSFAFEKPAPKIDLEKLKNLRKDFLERN